MSKQTQDGASKIISIQVEKYYAVFCDNRWYKGRILESEDANKKCLIEFLNFVLDRYNWQRKDDIDIQSVEYNFVFYRLIDVIGNGTLQIKPKE